MQYRLASWNVNGLRAVTRKGFRDWLEKGHPDGRPWDVVGLQETKLQEHQLPKELDEHPDYDVYLSSAKRPGYSGVALLVHKNVEPTEIIEGLGVDEYDDEGRSLTLIHEDFILINAYYPNGGRDLTRVPFKLEFSEEVLQLAMQYRKNKKRPVILAGDFNTAHTPIDLKNPKGNEKNTGFLPKERAWLDRLIEQGFVDVFRREHPGEEGHYTWWTYRANARARNVGWRIDYFFVDESSVKNVEAAKIHPEVMGSDHCPLSLTLNI